jgi:preprotein translocase subunit SecE
MNIVKRFTEYLQSSKTELEKVTWPSRKDTIRYSSLVLAVSVIVAIFFAGIDLGLSRLVTAMLQGRTDTTTETPVETTQEPVVPGLDLQPIEAEGTVVPTP